MLIGKKFKVNNHKINLGKIGNRLKDDTRLLIIHEKDLKNNFIIPYERFIYSDKTRRQVGLREPRNCIIITLKNGYAWVIFNENDFEKINLETPKRKLYYTKHKN